MSCRLRSHDGAADQFRDLRDDGVSEGLKSVHPSGNPMSHSTHGGFNCPPAALSYGWPSEARAAPESVNARPPFGWHWYPASFQSFAVGVGNRAAASLSMDLRCPGPHLSGIPERWFDAIGVGQKPTQRSKETVLLVSKFSTSELVDFRSMWSEAVGVGTLCVGFGVSPSRKAGVPLKGFRKSRGERPAERIARAFVLLASGVGNNPDAISLVRGANGGRRKAIPFRVIPALGQVPKNGSHPSTKQRCHVLQHGPLGSNHANGSHQMPVQSRTGAGQAGASAGVGKILAGEAADDDISLALLKVRSGHVRGLSGVREARGKHTPAEGVDLHDADRLEAAGALKAKVKAADAGEQGEHMPGLADTTGPRGQVPGRIPFTMVERPWHWSGGHDKLARRALRRDLQGFDERGAGAVGGANLAPGAVAVAVAERGGAMKFDGFSVVAAIAARRLIGDEISDPVESSRERGGAVILSDELHPIPRSDRSGHLSGLPALQPVVAKTW